MRASASAVDISPPVGIFLAGMGWNRPLSAGNHDSLMARCLVLEQADAKWVLVSTDLIAYSKHDWGRIRQRLIAHDPSFAQAVLTIACSHNHSSPAGYRAYENSIRSQKGIDVQGWYDYLDMVVERITGLIITTDRGMADAEVGFGMSSADVNMNRWHFTDDGRALFIPHNRELKPNGTTDRDVLVMAVRRKDGTPVAAIYNYAMHAITVCLQSDECTADFPGVAARIVEQAAGGQCLFLGGACGDIHPVEFDRGFPAAERAGRALADAVLGTLPGVAYSADLPLGLLERNVAIRVGDPDDPSIAMGAPEEMTIQAAAVGSEAAFITVPGEPYIDIALRIKEQSPFPRTGIVSLANDFVGGDGEPRPHTDYFALRESYVKYKYEPTYTRPDFTFESTDNLIRASLAMLSKLHNV